MTAGEPAPFAAADARRIAEAFLPDRPLGNRHDYYYVRTKLRSDPLYPGVLHALGDCDAPLLDLGCGLGLLAHVLRRAGRTFDYLGVDGDAAKIARARRAADRGGLDAVRFECTDLSIALPPHRGSVAILDVLQYLDPAAQQALLAGAAAMLAPGARLVIRSGIEAPGLRTRIMHGVDGFANRIGWMRYRPRGWPTLDALRAPLEAAGLQVSAAPLRGRTPFNNWMIVAERGP
jgi:SAM-dependent methyltransferase